MQHRINSTVLASHMPGFQSFAEHPQPALQRIINEYLVITNILAPNCSTPR